MLLLFFDYTNNFHRFSTYYGNNNNKREAWGHGDRAGARDTSILSLRYVFILFLCYYFFLTILTVSIVFLLTTATTTTTTRRVGIAETGKGLATCLSRALRASFYFIITFFLTILIISIVYLLTTATTTTTRSVGITETEQGLFFPYIFFW